MEEENVELTEQMGDWERSDHEAAVILRESVESWGDIGGRMSLVYDSIRFRMMDVVSAQQMAKTQPGGTMAWAAGVRDQMTDVLHTLDTAFTQISEIVEALTDNLATLEQAALAEQRVKDEEDRMLTKLESVGDWLA